MNQPEALELAAELVDLANDGEWPELLRRDLSGDVLEILRRKAQINLEITNLEAQERVLWLMLIEMLQSAEPVQEINSNPEALPPRKHNSPLIVS